MNRSLIAAAFAAGMTIFGSDPASAGDNSQLARSIGIKAGEAGAMSLDQLAAIKFSRDSNENRQAFVDRASAAGELVRSSRAPEGLSLDAYHVRLINPGVSADERHVVVSRDGIPSDLRARLQLARSVGISAGDAEAISLDEIAAQKFLREDDDS